MIQRMLNSRCMVACLLAMATGITLYFRMPFPDDNLYFELMYLGARPAFWRFKCTYILLLYTTPFIGYSLLLSGLYVFALKIRRPDKPGRLPRYQDPRKRDDLYIVVGKGKEPFWQQAYTNLVKFIILLHKVAFDYVTLFDVYHCAISPGLLQQRIQQAEELLFDKHFIFVSKTTYEEHIQALIDFEFLPDETKDTDQYRAPAIPALERHLKKHVVKFQMKIIPAPEKSDPDKRSQLEAVKRWFHDDWQRIEPKLKTSIVEGISVFPSLFDDNPKVKRVFCPPKECYDKEANTDGKFGKPLPSFSWLIETGKVCEISLLA